jgi:NAD(P)-dependent dehydrogenase (short-subunit alcohol dehydrogenase family)
LTLKDKQALVTPGIGRGIALELARQGAGVIVSSPDAVRGAETVAAIQAEGGRAVHADLGDVESLTSLPGGARRRHPRQQRRRLSDRPLTG